MQRTRGRARTVMAGLIAAGAAVLLPTALSVRADTSLATTTATTSLSMGDVSVSGQVIELAPMSMDTQPVNVPPTNPPCDADHGVPLLHARPCQSPPPGDKEDGHHHCDGDNDADDQHHCPQGSPSPTSNPSSTPSGTPSGTPSSSPSATPSGGAEDACETNGLAGETIADQLVDAGVPLNEPEDDGPISGPLETSLSSLDPVAAEVTCLVNLLGL
jgi:hypothetical protein